MTTAASNTDSLEVMEQKYHLVTGLYDLADELLSTVESPFVKDMAEQMHLVEPIIEEISNATDVLTEEFIHIAEHRRGLGVKANKNRIENALRRLFNAMNDYQGRVQSGTKKALAGMKNIADPIMEKIQRRVEEVVVMFLEFVQLALASIMHKKQLEAIRVRDPRIALMMHQYAMSQQ